MESHLSQGTGLLPALAREVDRYPGVRDALVGIRPASRRSSEFVVTTTFAASMSSKLKLEIALDPLLRRIERD